MGSEFSYTEGKGLNVQPSMMRFLVEAMVWGMDVYSGVFVQSFMDDWGHWRWVLSSFLHLCRTGIEVRVLRGSAG